MKNDELKIKNAVNGISFIGISIGFFHLDKAKTHVNANATHCLRRAKRTLFFILRSSFFILSFLCSLSVKAQGNIPEPELPTQYVEIKEEKPKIPFFQGFTLSADVV